MPFSTKEKFILATIGFLIFFIPFSAFVISYRFRAQSISEASFSNKLADYTPVTKESTSSALESLQKNLGQDAIKLDDSSTLTASFGPTLSFKVLIEGRPTSNQKTTVFLGIASGEPTNSPQYLLSFKVPIPESGSYPELSLAGLSQGSVYTAYIKGPAQIATTAAFLVKPSDNNIGTVAMTSGDLNEDNVINDLDLMVAKQALGAKATSTNWNANADLNLDGIVNNLDLTIITRNLGKIGAGGAWYSRISSLPTPQPQVTSVGSASSTLQITPTPSPQGATTTTSPAGKGYWIWVPSLE